MLSVILFGILIWQLMFFLTCDLHFVWQSIFQFSVISSHFIWCLFDILSDTYSGWFSWFFCAILSKHWYDILCDSWSGISSNILSNSTCHFIWHSIWHFIWHSIWHSMNATKKGSMCQIGFLIIRMPCRNGRILYVPGSMSENMPDRMSETCRNTCHLVGTTWSK